MGFVHSPRIVIDNLVLCLDAANSKSYSDGDTTWTDISGRENNMTLVNGASFDSGNKGSISFDGTNDYVDGDFTSDVQFGTGDFTFSTWLLLDSSTSNQNVFDTRKDAGSGASSADKQGFMLRTTDTTTNDFRFEYSSLQTFSAPVSSDVSPKHK